MDGGNVVPSFDVHALHAKRFLLERNVTINVMWIDRVNRAIDEPQKHLKRAFSELCEYSKDFVSASRPHLETCFSVCRELWFFKYGDVSHDVYTQRISKTGWSETMISNLRVLFACLYGEDYGLLVDLHVILDMADKLCCDDEVLLNWAHEVGVSEEVLQYYQRHRREIDLQLSCTKRLKAGKCGRMEVARLLRGFPTTDWAAVHGARIGEIIRRHHPVVSLLLSLTQWYSNDVEYLEYSLSSHLRKPNRGFLIEYEDLLKRLVRIRIIRERLESLAQELVRQEHAVRRADASSEAITVDWDASNYIFLKVKDCATKILKKHLGDQEIKDPNILEKKVEEMLGDSTALKCLSD